MALEEDKVVIMMTTYNGSRFLSEQLNSLAAQSFKDWSLVVFDDCSQDETREILRQYQNKEPFLNKMSVFFNESAFGSAKSNMLNGVDSVDASYIFFCDQDDVWDKEKISSTLEVLKKHERVLGKTEIPVLIYSDARVTDSELNVTQASFFKSSGINPHLNDLSHLLVQSIAPGCTMAFNKALLKLLQQVGDRPEIAMHDWWASLVAVATGGVIGCLDSAMISYRQHGANSVGASRPFSIPYVRSKSYSAHRNLALSQQQASLLLNEFSDLISPEKRRVLIAYSGLSGHLKPVRVFTTLRYRFWKQGLVRKLGQIVCM